MKSWNSTQSKPRPNFDTKPKKVRNIKRYVRIKNCKGQGPDGYSELFRAQLMTGAYTDHPVAVEECPKSQKKKSRRPSLLPRLQSTPHLKSKPDNIPADLNM